MKIQKIELKNFKCFSEKLIPLKDLTLFTGLNGMGKSTAIQSLLVLAQSRELGTLGSVGLSLNGHYVRLGNGFDVMFREASEEFVEINITSNATDSLWKFQYEAESELLPIIQNDKISNLDFFNGLQYLNAERLGPRVINQASKYNVYHKKSIGTQGEFAAHFLSENIDYSVDEKRWNPNADKIKELRYQTEAWLNEITPGTRLEIEYHPEMDAVNLEYSFSRPQKTSEYHRSTNVGFGLTYILPVIVALLTAQKNSILIIENPEAHLHPRGQFIMGELIARVASSGVQVIIESHSDHLLNGVRLAVKSGYISNDCVQINYLRINEKGESELETPVIDENGRIDKWPKGFFDEWENSLKELIKVKK